MTSCKDHFSCNVHSFFIEVSSNNEIMTYCVCISLALFWASPSLIFLFHRSGPLLWTNCDSKWRIKMGEALKNTSIFSWMNYSKVVYQINDLLKVDTDCATFKVLVVLRIVNQDRDLLWSNLSRSVAKHKQHGVNHVWLSASVWANNWCETLCVYCAYMAGENA